MLQRTLLATLVATSAALRPPLRLAPLRTLSTLRATPDADKSVDAAIDQAAAKMASAKQIARATLPGNRRALALWRVGWLSWWCQIILTTISAVVLTFAKVSAPSTATNPEAALASGFLFASAGAVFSLMSSFWTWRLVRLARLESSEASGVQKIVRRTQKALRFGAKLNLVGMALTLLAAEQVVGTLIMKALVAPGSLAGVWSGTAPQAMQVRRTASLVLRKLRGAMDSVSDFESGGCGFESRRSWMCRHAQFPLTQAFNTIDVFVIQATTNTLCAHFISLLSTLSLLARSVKW